MHRKRFKLPIPQIIARCQAAFLEFLYPRLFRKASPLNRDQLIMLEEGNTGNGQSADRLFGLRHLAFREGFARYLIRPGEGQEFP